MQPKWTRQAAVVGLAFVLLVLLTGSAWTHYQATRVQFQLGDAARWLREAVIVVDPGHGGDDPGGVVQGTLEKGIVLEIGKALQQVLEANGARVVMTRSTDVNLGGRIRVELGRRVALVDQHRAHVYVSIHANKDRCNCWGAQTFYQRDGKPEGKLLAQAIQDELRRLTPTTRVPLSADYFVLRNSPVPAAMVEVGFLTNAQEMARLKDPGYQRTLATAIALGVSEFFRSQIPDARAGGSIGK